MIKAKSHNSVAALKCVEYLQTHFVNNLNEISKRFGKNKAFERIDWLRDEGLHGGGSRYEARDDAIFNRASVNVSQVHYDDDETKKLASASAISTIIHPKNPKVPSMHMHISLTQMRDGGLYWRLMADLNPSIENINNTNSFNEMLQEISGKYYQEGKEQGDKYFFIPALNRTRGVSHFYLENFNSGDFKADERFALEFGLAVIDMYINIIKGAILNNPLINETDRKEQLAYHTLYLFQVLTLDRGTTSGLLIHDQNDIGIMGSIPSHIDTELLKSWVVQMEKPQDELLMSIIDTLGEGVVLVDEDMKKRLAIAVREHYKKHPKALSMQASGNSVPPTVDNHK